MITQHLWLFAIFSTGFTDIPLTSMRTVIAKRLTESKQTSPHGHATVNTSIDSILQLRKDLAARGIKVSVNDFIIKAVGTALQYVPEMNLNVSGEDFQVGWTVHAAFTGV